MKTDFTNEVNAIVSSAIDESSIVDVEYLTSRVRDGLNALATWTPAEDVDVVRDLVVQAARTKLLERCEVVAVEIGDGVVSVAAEDDPSN